MRVRLRDIPSSLLATILILIVLEIIATAFIPALGIQRYRLAFNVLIILYLSFKIETPYLPVIILVIQYFHSAFTIEGWAYGTFTGVLISVIVSYVKDMLQFTTVLSTVVVTQIFQTIWFFIMSILVYLRTESFAFILDKFWSFIPESLVLSLLSPFAFVALDKIWTAHRQDHLGAEL